MTRRQVVRRGTAPKAVLLLALLSAAAFGLLGVLAPSRTSARGDEPTYQAMAESLVHDGDLRFTEADRGRREESAETVILQRTAAGVGYSKPVLYPLLAAPLVALLGPRGFEALNLLALLAALAAGWACLRRTGTAADSALTLLTFLATGVPLFYLVWRMGDLLQFSLALAGLALALGGERPSSAGNRRWHDRLLEAPAARLVGGFSLGLLAALRYTNGLIAAAPVAALVLSGRRARAALVLAGALVGFAGASLLNRELIGTVNPYKAVRASFNPATGYPAGADAERAGLQFDEQTKTYRMTIRPQVEPSLSLYASLYFLCGRHTGLLLYFPAAICLALAALRRPDRVSATLIVAAAALLLFYLIWLPRNYFGGATFLGNRYFLAAYPAVLVALRRPPGWRALAPAWAVALVVALSAAVSLSRAAPLERSSQLHAYAGIFRWLPFESTAEAIDGPRDRYWSDELVRFNDPYAEVERWGFHLTTGAPPTELMVASPREHGILRFIVQADAPEVELVFSDYRQRRSVRLQSARGEEVARGVVEIHASPAWRRHRFPWRQDALWRAWVVRLELRRPGGGEAKAELRYLGPYRLLPKFYAHQTVAAELPLRAPAGGESRLPIQALNRGRRPWSSQAAVPVHLRYRLEPIDGSDSVVVGRVTRLRGEVEHRNLLDGTVRVRWPQRPGRYRLTVDLVLGGTVWFEQIGGTPLARGEVEVVEG